MKNHLRFHSIANDFSSVERIIACRLNASLFPVPGAIVTPQRFPKTRAITECPQVALCSPEIRLFSRIPGTRLKSSKASSIVAVQSIVVAMARVTKVNDTPR
jgi:hypothetical protein